jgi:polyisoprenoid-binding protein YceI
MRYLFLIPLLLLAVGINANDYIIDSNSEDNQVQFESTAKLEFIKGESSNITGLIKFNPQNPNDTTFAIIQVDLLQLKTGIETRDEHMWDRHLHTKEYPNAFFELLKIINMPQVIHSDSSYIPNGEGYFYIHGVKRKLNPKIIFKWDENKNQVDINTNFQIKLDDYHIPRPKALFLKLAKIIEVNVKFIGYSNLPIPTINLPDYPELQ